MQEPFWWWQCSDRYIISLFPHLHTPFPPFSPSLISLMFFVDVKHHVYLLQSMTWSHCCWFITNIWKSDHHLNMTLGTGIVFTLSFLSAKSVCWWKSEFCLISRLTSFEARTILIQMGRAYLVTWTVLCFQFHTHRSFQHSKANHYF